MYDIYGTEGLAAGLQVVPSGKDTQALKQEWEGFRAQQVMPIPLWLPLMPYSRALQPQPELLSCCCKSGSHRIPHASTCRELSQSQSYLLHALTWPFRSSSISSTAVSGEVS